MLEKQDNMQHLKVVNFKVVQFFGEDFNYKDQLLEAQLVQLHAGGEKALNDVQAVVKYTWSHCRLLRGITIVKSSNCSIVMPAINTSEQSFSALPGLKVDYNQPLESIIPW